jgi:hypothetical protein
MTSALGVPSPKEARMYRIAMALMLGITSLLIAYGQFRALPGHEIGSLDLTETVRDALIICVSVDASELCPLPLDYLKQADTLHDSTTLILLAAVRFVVFVAFT